MKFNLEPLLNNIQNQLNAGLLNIMSEFIENYETYEETHNHILNLPLVKKMQLSEKANDLLLDDKYGMNSNIVSKQMENIYKLKEEVKFLKKELEELREENKRLKQDENITIKIEEPVQEKVKIKEEKIYETILDTAIQSNSQNIIEKVQEELVVEVKVEKQEEEVEEDLAQPFQKVEEEEEEDEEEDEEEEEEEEVEEEDLAQPFQKVEEEEVYQVEIKGVSYYTEDDKNGKIYKIEDDEEIGDEVGVFVKGKAQFHKK